MYIHIYMYIYTHMYIYIHVIRMYIDMDIYAYIYILFALTPCCIILRMSLFSSLPAKCKKSTGKHVSS